MWCVGTHIKAKKNCTTLRNSEVKVKIKTWSFHPEGLGLQWNAHSKAFWTLTFEPLGRNIAPLRFKNERVAETTLRASWFWPTSAWFAGTWGIFSSPGDSKLTPEGLGLQWNGHSKTFWALTLELLGRKIAPKSREDRLAHIVILTNLGSISRNLGDIFQSRGL